jgi:hypothetical protein
MLVPPDHAGSVATHNSGAELACRMLRHLVTMRGEMRWVLCVPRSI